MSRLSRNIFFQAFLLAIFFLIDALGKIENSTQIGIDLLMVKNFKNLLSLNISYDESKQAYDILDRLKKSYLNYSKEIENITKNDLDQCYNEIEKYNCSYKTSWKEEIEKLQNENNFLNDLIKNKLTNERYHICTNFTFFEKKIQEEEKNYNNSLETLQIHLIGIKTAFEILKDFYNLTTLSTLFLQFKNYVKLHDNLHITKTINEIKSVTSNIKEKIKLEENNENKMFKNKRMMLFKAKNQNLISLKEENTYNFNSNNLKSILKVFDKINTLLELFQNSTTFLTNYHNSIIDYYTAKVETLKSMENVNENRFNESFSKISENTINIKNYEEKINICIGKASEKSDCDIIQKKSEELLSEVSEFITIIDEVMREFEFK